MEGQIEKGCFEELKEDLIDPACSEELKEDLIDQACSEELKKGQTDPACSEELKMSVDEKIQEKELICQKSSDGHGLKCKEKNLGQVDLTLDNTDEDFVDNQDTKTAEMPEESRETNVCSADIDESLSKWHSLVLEGKIEVLDWSSYKFTCSFEGKDITIHFPDDLVMNYMYLQNRMQEESAIPYHLLVHTQCSCDVAKWQPVCGWFGKTERKCFVFSNHKILTFDKENDILCLITNNDSNILYLRCETRYIYVFSEKSVLSIENYVQEPLQGTLHVVVESVPVYHWKGFPVMYRVHLLSTDKSLAEVAINFLMLGKVSNNPCGIKLVMTEESKSAPQCVSVGTSCSEALPKMCDSYILRMNDCVNISFSVYAGIIDAADRDGFEFTFYVKKKKLSYKVSANAALDYCDCLDIFKCCCLPFHLIVCNVSINHSLSVLPICGWFRKISHDAYIIHNLSILYFSPEDKIAVMEDQNGEVHFLYCNSFEMCNELHKTSNSLPLYVIVENIPLLQVKGFVVRQRILFMSDNKELAFTALKFLVLLELDNEMLDCKFAHEHIVVRNSHLDQNLSSSPTSCCLQNDVCCIQHKPDCKYACLHDNANWETFHMSLSQKRNCLANEKLDIIAPGDILQILQGFNEVSGEACNCMSGSTYFVPSQVFEVEDQMKRFVGQFRPITEDYGIITCKVKAKDVVCHRSAVYIDGKGIASLLELNEEVLRNISVIAVPLLKNINIQYKSSCARHIAAVAWHGSAPNLFGIHQCSNHRPTLFCADGNYSFRGVDLCTSSDDEEAAFICGKGKIVFYAGKRSLKGSRLKIVDVELDCIFANEVAFFCKAMKGFLWCPLSSIYYAGERCQSVYDVSKVKKFKCIYSKDLLQNLDVREKKYCIIAFAKSEVIPGIHICENHDGILLTRVKTRDCADAESDRCCGVMMQDQSDKNLKYFWKDVTVSEGSSVSTPEINHDCDSSMRESINQQQFIDIQPIFMPGLKIQLWECVHVEENFALLCSAGTCGILLQEDFYLNQNILCPPEEFTIRMFVGQKYNGLFTGIQQHLFINDKLVSHIAIYAYCCKEPLHFKKIISDLKSSSVKCLKILSSVTSLSVAGDIPYAQTDGLLTGYSRNIKTDISTQDVNTNCRSKSDNEKNSLDNIDSTSNIEGIVTDTYNFKIKPLQLEKISASHQSITQDLLLDIHLTDERTTRRLMYLYIEDNFAIIQTKKRKNKLYALLLREDFCLASGDICSPEKFKSMMTDSQGYIGEFAKMQQDLIVNGCVIVTHVALVVYEDKKPSNFKQILLASSRNPIKRLKAYCSSISITRAQTSPSMQFSDLVSHADNVTIDKERKCEVAESMSFSKATTIRTSSGEGLGQLQVIDINPESISELEHLTGNCVHVDNNFALLKSNKFIGIILQEDFYSTQSALCPLAELKNKMFVRKCYHGIFTKMQHDLMIQDQLVTHVAVYAYVGKKPFLSEQIISHWKSNPMKSLKVPRSCIGNLKRNQLTAPSETCNFQVARNMVVEQGGGEHTSMVVEQGGGEHTYKKCVWRCMETIGQIYKLNKKSGILEVYTKTFGNGRAAVFFDESVVFIDKKRIPADKSFVEVLTSLQEEPWSCIARPFPGKKGKKRVITGVEVDMIAVMVWKGSKPSKQERNMADKEIISQILKTKFESKVTRTKRKRIREEIFKGRVVGCNKTFGWLKDEEESDWIFERDDCSLYGISLCEVDLKHVLPIGTEVWFSLSADKLSIIKVWAGSYHPLDWSDALEKVREWCESFEVPESDADILMVEVGWVSPKFEPTVALGDEKEVVEIC